ncbi:hypothetical protein [Hyalangium minutum]|uniref:Mannanase galactose-binding domain-containing protein n=1 Tax=Hyalangium minutum TaxID=394096 RepID=A0A085W869_9BACT|nr:hypothetical protein [Hyalangium minutum]KFE63882.1 hypothetical protein DB31_2294 [Hyalangium minutum]
MRHFIPVLALAALAACGPELIHETPADSQRTTGQSAVVGSVYGSIPAGLPARLQVGLFEDTGQTWMQSSAVPWDVRYRYFVKGWINNFGWGAADGQWGLQYMQECQTQGFLPAIQYYQMNGEPGGGEAQFLAKAQNAGTMRSYFADFKVLMQRAKEFGKPVMVLVEADGFAYLQKQSANNPNAYAAVAATGLPELSGLPNTVAGWGLAFLQLRKAVGASNVVLGIHISAWAGSGDIAHFSVTQPLEPEVTQVHTFLKPLGLAANVTGATWDVLVGDPLDRDADFYRLTQSGQDRWWAESDTASILSKSFNRYAEWLRLWNVASGKRWVLWQIPLGNSNHLNTPNTGNAREGYKDNRPEYFFGPNGATHREKFASSGVIALLFGKGEGQQSSYTNDVYTDGQPFMKSRAGAFLKAGGLAIPATGSTPPGGPPPPPTEPTPPPTPSPPPATSSFDFESGTQGWTRWGIVPSVSSSTARAFAGRRSLEVKVAGAPSGVGKASVAGASVPAGRTVSFRVWLPTGSRVTAIQPYLLQGASGGWRWSGSWFGVSSLKADAWNTLTLPVPSNAVSPFAELGLEIFTGATWTGSLYVDSVSG